MTKGKFPNGLAAAMKAKKIGPTALGRAAGVPKQYVDRWASQQRRLTPEDASKLAPHLDTTAAALLLVEDEPNLAGPAVAQSQIAPSYAGIVQAGEFRSVDEWSFQDPDEVPDHVRIDPTRNRVRQYAWQARGDSMNMAGIFDGMWVVGADAADYIDQYGDIVTGDLVVVERTRYQGSERELTVKEIHFFKDRYELRPVSSNEEHQPIVVPHNHETEDDTEVRIIGVVLTAYADLKKRRA